MAREEVLVFRLKGQDDGASLVPVKAANAVGTLEKAVEDLANATASLEQAERSAGDTATASFHEAEIAERTLLASTKQLNAEWKRSEELRQRGLSVLRSASRNGATFQSEIDDFRSAVEKTNPVLDQHQSVTSRVRAEVVSFGREINVNVDHLKKYAIAAGAAVAVVAALGVGLVKRGFDQVTTLQQAQFSMGAIIASSGDIVDENGHILAGQEKINTSLGIARDQVAQLKIEAIETTANFRDLVAVMQVAEKPALAAGFRIDQIVPFVKSIAQTGGALGIPSNMLPQEVRALLAGEKGPDNQIANALLGDVSKAEFDKLKEAGELFEFLMKRMEAFAATGEMASATLSGALSNLQDAFDQALGEATQGNADSMAAQLRNLTDEIVRFDAAGRPVFNEDFVAGIRLLANGLVFLAESAVLAAEKLPEWKRKFNTFLAGLAGGRGAAAIVSAQNEQASEAAAAAAAAADAERQASIQRGHTFLFDQRPGRQMGFSDRGPGTVVTPSRWNAGDRDAEIGAFLRELDDQREAIFRAKMAEAAKDKVVTAGERIGAMDAADKPINRFREILKGYTKDGVLMIADFRAAKGKFETEMAKAASDRVKVSTNKTADKAAEKLKEQLDEYGDVIAKYQTKSQAADNPFATRIADIAARQLDAVDKVEDARQKFGESARDWQADLDTVNDFFKREAEKVQQDRNDFTAGVRLWLDDFNSAAPGSFDPIEKQIEEINRKRQKAIEDFRKKVTEGGAEMLPMEALLGIGRINASFDADIQTFYKQRVADPITAMAREGQKEVEDTRIALIEDSIDRELSERSRAIDEWFTKEKEAHAAEKEFLDALDQERMKREQKATDDARQARERERVGSREWARQLALDTRRELGTVPQQLTDNVKAARAQLGGLFEGVFDALIDDTFDAGQQIEAVMKGLGKTWAGIVSDMIKRSIFGGQSIVSQIRQIMKSMDDLAKQPGAGKFLDIGLQGAGIGSFVGGIFGGPNNFGAEGGTIGGAAGAIIGTLLGGHAALGSIIGSAIGTAIGSMIQKGKDEIRVSIRDNIVAVTETGISAEARNEVQTQISRRVHDEMKSWQAILDLLPQEYLDQLAALHIRKPTLNMDGGVEEGDLRDETALGSLNDFMSNRLPRAAFSEYRQSFEAALQIMGADSDRINSLFAYWGQLQGQELHDAVETFFRATIDQQKLKSEFSAPWEDHKKAAQDALTANDPLTRFRSINDQVATIVASMSQLTDVDDIVSAQQRVNDLMREGRNAELAALQQLNAARQQSRDSLDAQREQIQLVDMDDNQKLDYFFRRMTDLRSQLERTTDPAEVQRIQQQMQGYISQVLSITGDPNDPAAQAAMKANRERLLAIIEDIGGLTSTAYDNREQEIQDQAQKAAETLQEAGDKLLLAAGQLPGGGGDKPDLPERPDPPPGGGDNPDPDHPRPRDPRSLDELHALLAGKDGETVWVVLDDREASARYQALVATMVETQARVAEFVDKQQPDVTAIANALAAAIARSIAQELRGITIPVDVEATVDDRGFVTRAVRASVQYIKDNPSSIQSRTERY
jgi:hypothetical protein